MAARKKTASGADAGKMVVAFALRDFEEGEGEAVVRLKKDQRVELSRADFAPLAKRGVCVEGVFVKMKTSIQGKRYNLSRGKSAWLAPHVYEAWKKVGYCEITNDDPDVATTLKARDEAVRDAVLARDGALAELSKASAMVASLQLEMQVAKAQAGAVLDAASDILDGDLDDLEPLKAELQKLIDMFPDQIELDAPELALS